MRSDILFSHTSVCHNLKCQEAVFTFRPGVQSEASNVPDVRYDHPLLFPKCSCPGSKQESETLTHSLALFRVPAVSSRSVRAFLVFQDGIWGQTGSDLQICLFFLGGRLQRYWHASVTVRRSSNTLLTPLRAELLHIQEVY